MLFTDSKNPHLASLRHCLHKTNRFPSRKKQDALDKNAVGLAGSSPGCSVQSLSQQTRCSCLHQIKASFTYAPSCGNNIVCMHCLRSFYTTTLATSVKEEEGTRSSVVHKRWWARISQTSASVIARHNFDDFWALILLLDSPSTSIVLPFQTILKWVKKMFMYVQYERSCAGHYERYN